MSKEMRVTDDWTRWAVNNDIDSLVIEEIARIGLVVASDAIAEVLDMNEDELLIIGAYLAHKLNQENDDETN